MIWSLLAQGVMLVLDLLRLRYSAKQDKDLEVLVLRQQIRILERRVGKPVRPSRVEKLLLALTTVHIKERAREGRKRFRDSILLFKPATVLKWHRELVKRKWTFQQRAKVGRPRIEAELEALIVRLANENPGLGYEKLQGELLKLGYDVGISTVRDVLERHHIPPAPERDRSRNNWRTFLNHYRTQILACDFFTIETVFLKTIYVLFFIDMGTRRVCLAGCTRHPDSAWVTQQARQLTWQLQEQKSHTRFLIHDRDSKFTGSFEAVFAAEGIETVLTPNRAPNAKEKLSIGISIMAASFPIPGFWETCNPIKAHFFKGTFRDRKGVQLTIRLMPIDSFSLVLGVRFHVSPHISRYALLRKVSAYEL
jgi:hypothetical protein